MTVVGEELTAELAALAAGISGIPETSVLAHRPDGTVVRSGALVAKAHAGDTDREALTVRLGVAAHPLLRGILLAPLPLPAPRTGSLLHGRPVTAWPLGVPVDREEPGSAPWEDAAVLLARLHAVPPQTLPYPLPPMRGPAKAARAVARMTAGARSPAADTVLRAWECLPGWARDEAPQPRADTLCHGDLHLGQLVRHPAPGGPWQLIDVDDLGIGDPAWDLARPAMWFATGLLDPDAWTRFLGAYRDAGGRAVPPDGDPWPYLDVPARALTVQSAALAVVRAARENRPLDEVEQDLTAACARITHVS
ncbi:aminoglycoside phosphotransferase family protein [Streptomyces sp. SID13666]|uniref:phosphotransferase family protein n=1 Tax=unclassified Streptomyces TaxID=2593676 RepID=UPI001106E16B|nr:MULTISPECIES: aminoglycoside phosphotransferase family protein [unclassified Streptomyces]NEA60788.1 aminoglycoside phosphotransferase family protein [Streptomyces sp. SID13666]NEA75252.1 aminoglycoside phosphotransferase family protein [Streptomyces sp. SID13588]QNA72441.1 aminoglycoside phosphotransferase family protein [Streptomyces sp. So13.3]